MTAGLAIYDTMQWVSCDVATYCIGQCASMGSLLLAAGAKGKRNALPHSRIMIHQPLAGMEGTATEILIHAEEFIRMKKQLNQIYQKHTGQTLEKLQEDTDRDRFMSPEEAREYGLIDNVVDREPPIPLNPEPGSRERRAVASEFFEDRPRWPRESGATRASRPGPTAKPESGGWLGVGIVGRAIVEVQLDEAVGIAVGRDAPERPDDDAHAGLLEAFAGRGRGRGFARLALAAGEFPVPGVDGPLRAPPDQETVCRGG